jgi:hypothetical protein
VSVWQRAGDLKIPPSRQQRFVAQHRAQGGYLLRLPFGEIGKGAVLDLSGFTVGFAQQDGGR